MTEPEPQSVFTAEMVRESEEIAMLRQIRTMIRLMAVGLGLLTFGCLVMFVTVIVTAIQYGG
jgi:hypothetical protein